MAFNLVSNKQTPLCAIGTWLYCLRTVINLSSRVKHDSFILNQSITVYQLSLYLFFYYSDMHIYGPRSKRQVNMYQPYLFTIHLTKLTIAGQTLETVPCKMHSFCQNAISFGLLYSRFVSFNIQTLFMQKTTIIKRKKTKKQNNNNKKQTNQKQNSCISFL